MANQAILGAQEELVLNDLPMVVSGDDMYFEAPCTDACETPCGPAAGACYGPPVASPIWIGAEFLRWWTEGYDTPPLVTTAPSNTELVSDGVLGQPGTDILFGGCTLNDAARSGGRYTIGYVWPGALWSAEVAYLHLDKEKTGFYRHSFGDPVLARPYSDAQSGADVAKLVAYTDIAEGAVLAEASTEFRSLEALFRKSLLDDCLHRLDLLIGYRYVELDDDLLIGTRQTSHDDLSGAAEGTTTSLFDRFNTQNSFHGVQLGTSTEVHYSRWSLELLLKLALGVSRSDVRIQGGTATSYPNGGATSFGMLVQDTNAGLHKHHDFAMVPELGVRLNYDFWCRWRFSLGYTFIYWSRVARPGDQIDTDLNLTQVQTSSLVGGATPEFIFFPDDFWAQGLSVGLEYAF